jgi:small subunit ribosomal protein S20
MANIKSQKKRIIQNEKRRVRNLAVRSELKTRIKRARDGAASSTDDVQERLRLAQKRLAKAGEKGIIHKNQAARRTSRLMREAAKHLSGE